MLVEASRSIFWSFSRQKENTIQNVFKSSTSPAFLAFKSLGMHKRQNCDFSLLVLLFFAHFCVFVSWAFSRFHFGGKIFCEKPEDREIILKQVRAGLEKVLRNEIFWWKLLWCFAFFSRLFHWMAFICEWFKDFNCNWVSESGTFPAPVFRTPLNDCQTIFPSTQFHSFIAALMYLQWSLWFPLGFTSFLSLRYGIPYFHSHGIFYQVPQGVDFFHTEICRPCFTSRYVSNRR